MAEWGPFWAFQGREVGMRAGRASRLPSPTLSHCVAPSPFPHWMLGVEVRRPQLCCSHPAPEYWQSLYLLCLACFLAFVSWSCYKLPPTGCLKGMETYFLTVLEAQTPRIKCVPVCTSLTRLQRSNPPGLSHLQRHWPSAWPLHSSLSLRLHSTSSSSASKPSSWLSWEDTEHWTSGSSG